MFHSRFLTADWIPVALKKRINSSFYVLLERIYRVPLHSAKIENRLFKKYYGAMNKRIKKCAACRCQLCWCGSAIFILSNIKNP